eukprot:COSAG01_NODE_1131_length_11572_cov_84.273337_7_plen_411_part_00
MQSPHLFAMFHNDTDRRDFISMGAAAGFAAAFGAPIGGVLFALEEASSFWSAKLMWRLLLCTSTACFTLSILRTIRSSLGPEVEEDGQLGAGEINAKFEPGMLTLNTQKDLNFKHEWELIICAIEGCMCGVLGALFNKLNEVVSGWRPKARPTTAKDVAPLIRLLGVSRQHSLRIIEVLVISVVTSIVMYGLPYWGATSSHWVAFYPDNSTEILGPDGEKMGWACHCDDSVFPYCGRQAPAVQSYRYSTYSFYCPPQDIYGNQIYNDMASIFLSSRENAILSLIEHPHNFSFTSLTLMGLSFFFLMLLAFGAAYPAGIFMPTVVIGTTFGALFGRFVKYFLCFALTKGCTIAGGDKNVDVQDSSWTNHDDSFRATTIEHAGPYALLGAVGLLGGIQRSSLSLVVIIVEGA